MGNKEFFDNAWEGVADWVLQQALDISQMVDKGGIAYRDLFNLLKNKINSTLDSLGKELDEMED